MKLAPVLSSVGAFHNHGWVPAEGLLLVGDAVSYGTGPKSMGRMLHGLHAELALRNSAKNRTKITKDIWGKSKSALFRQLFFCHASVPCSFSYMSLTPVAHLLSNRRETSIIIIYIYMKLELNGFPKNKFRYFSNLPKNVDFDKTDMN